MKEGYSRLLINDWILPNIGCPLTSAMFDISMMCCLTGMERIRKQWTELLISARFKIIKFWLDQAEAEAEGVLEAEQNGLNPDSKYSVLLTLL